MLTLIYLSKDPSVLDDSKIRSLILSISVTFCMATGTFFSGKGGKNVDMPIVLAKRLGGHRHIHPIELGGNFPPWPSGSHAPAFGIRKARGPPKYLTRTRALMATRHVYISHGRCLRYYYVRCGLACAGHLLVVYCWLVNCWLFIAGWFSAG